MYIRCPHCRTVFALHAHELRAANGRVRCPECGQSFDALAQLYDSREEAEAAAQAGSQGLDIRNLQPVSPGWGLAVATPGVPAGGRKFSPGPDTVEIPAVLLEDFQQRPAHTGRRLLQGVVVLLLLLTLLGQGVHLQRERLYTLSEWQPWLERFCAHTGCELPLRRAPEQWVIERRSIEAHPQREHVLAVELTLVNDADFTQAWPLVGVFFSDLTGRRQAGRWFRPADYLPASARPAKGVPAGARRQLQLALVDPGAELVSYQFDFR